MKSAIRLKSISDNLGSPFINGIPEYEIHHMLFPYEIAERSWSFFKAIFENMICGDVDYIIEVKPYCLN
ncbi:hypothetical protein GCM10023311_22090 [Flaviramulus aquimarinus]|uniref:Uncharacterized protein n=1 Tax=Flaviramulus aquimarinus TaxID=1170456 RepID=A0ABP9FAF1_9FLAO